MRTHTCMCVLEKGTKLRKVGSTEDSDFFEILLSVQKIHPPSFLRVKSQFTSVVPWDSCSLSPVQIMIVLISECLQGNCFMEGGSDKCETLG